MNTSFIKNGLQLGLLVLMTWIISSCSSGYLKSFENVSKQKTQYDKIVVAARIADQTGRIKFENDVVGLLKEKGIQAVPSYQVELLKDANKEFTDADLDALTENLKQAGFDGGIVTNFIKTEQYQQVVPGNTSTYYYPRRIGRFGRGLVYYPVTTWQPDRIETGVQYQFQSAFYKIDNSSSEHLQWIGAFEVKDPRNLDNATMSYARELVQALMEQSIQQ